MTAQQLLQRCGCCALASASSTLADTFIRVDLVDAFSLATDLLERHGLGDWQVEFDRAKRRAGQCQDARRVIGLSAPLTRLHDEAEVRDTILHEIAHAVVGSRHGHDEVWRSKALAIGCSGKRCVDENAPRVPGDWVGTCAAGHSVERHKRPEAVLSCKRCSEDFSAENVYEWTYRGRPAPMHPNYVRQLEDLRAGRRRTLLPVGAQVRVVVPGDYDGSVGTLVKRGRTCYHVQLAEVRLRVLFAGVELAEPPHGNRAEPISLAQRGALVDSSIEETVEAVYLSLLTADGRLRTLHASGEQRQWSATLHDDLREALIDDRAFKRPSEDEPGLLSRVYLAEDALLVPLSHSPEEVTAKDVRRFQIAGDSSVEPAWEDWYRVDWLLRDLARAAWRHGSYLSLSTEPPSHIRVRCLIGRTEQGQESIFIHATHRPPNDSVQGHDVWQRAVRRGEEYVLEAPFNEDMLDAAGTLMMVALRAQGLSPLDVFPAETVDWPLDRSPSHPRG